MDEFLPKLTKVPKKFKISNRKHTEIYANLLKICQHLQTEMGARHMLIGGDFNVSDVVFKNIISDEKLGLTIHTQTNKTERREHKDVIDFFISSKNIKCKSMIAQPDIQGVDYSQLESHFDHDLIRAKFTVHAEERSHTEDSSDVLTNMTRKLALREQSEKAYKHAVQDLHKAHLEAIVEVLKSENPKKWKTLRYDTLIGSLKSTLKLGKFKNIELRLILQHLKVSFPKEAQKEDLVRLLFQVYSGCEFSDCDALK